jgi:hypothetical protein
MLKVITETESPDEDFEATSRFLGHPANNTNTAKQDKTCTFKPEFILKSPQISFQYNRVFALNKDDKDFE